MRVKEKLQYHKQQDCFVGHADLGSAEHKDIVLANSLLCFVMSGLSTSYRIPVGNFFTKGLTGAQLHELVLFIMKKVETCAFRITRIVTDNHKVNVHAFKLLGYGCLIYRIEHPCDPERPLFLSFDPCHVLKNVRSQFLAHDIGPKGEISSSHLKAVYELQKDLTVRPVRYLSRKHVYPNNIEKMNVGRAVQVLSPAVTAALEHLKEQAGHTCSVSFASTGPSITFMKCIYRCQDRGGLLYPSYQLPFVLDTLRTFAEQALKENHALEKPLTNLVERAVPALCGSNLLKCKDSDEPHRLKLMELISVRFLRPLLSNYAFSVTNKHDAYRYFAKTPLSRKCLKL
ncbi:hypothetical protein HPB49_004011 [Dermacentor silvarum]|uniref:Uncharacterized protein n=1 Tax=Dermacentor silvarum TaxID=543639 RepID=A0ACB8DN92_DERSI|nr:hypothetical protein HPB49_004011 [Dermacentor silvarum]